MLNWLWFGLLALGIAFGGLQGDFAGVSAAALEAAADSVVWIMEMTGLLCLWLGMLKIAEASGLMQKIARLFSPAVAFLFPDVPRQHPAFTSMLMNMAANFLGLGNAATPFGLKAMEQLQSLNPHPDRASRPMITFLAVNTSGITLIPTLVISLRTAAGSAAPTEIIGAAVFATGCGTAFALIFDAILRKSKYGRS